VDTLDWSGLARRRPISVGVTVDLEFGDGAGGHVKCWQRIAEAAAQNDTCDLTVYFLGAQPSTITLGEHVRFRTVPARRGTQRLGLRNGGGHTDLARVNPAIEPLLLRHDVLHATAPFALSGSAQRIAESRGKPLVASVHTDNPALTRHYVPEVLGGLLGDSAALRGAMRWLHLPEIGAGRMARRVRRGLAGAWHLLYSNQRQHDGFRADFPTTARSRLRRGVDHACFHPGLRDRMRLEARFGIPRLTPVLAFAGRIDTSKNADLAAAAAEALWSTGLDFALLMLGQGALRAPLARRLGPRAVLPGFVPQDDLAWILASADAFIFPSETETVGNAVLEAQASGLPIFVMADTAPAEAIQDEGKDGVSVASRNPDAWAHAIGPILAEPACLNGRRRAARRAGAQLPSWREVLEEDLVPIWCGLAGRMPVRSGERESVAAEAVD